MSTLHTIFFLGKGGTGKSTASALLSLALMQQGKKVLLASLDDAHNQSDIFEHPFSDKACSIGPCLEVLQVNREKEIKRYLSKTAQAVKHSYSYLKAFNLDNYFDVLKYSPGMEEYALVSAFKGLQQRFATYDYLIIDMPPTALALRFFNLPSLSLTWVQQLEKLRMDIRQRKEIISKIKFPGKEFERDKTLARIREIKKDHQALQAFFQDPKKCRLFGVFNQDRLSIAETRRIIEQLVPLKLNLNGLICNQRIPKKSDDQDMAGDEMGNEFMQIPVMSIPYSETPLVGMEKLQEHMELNHLTFDEILPEI